MDDGMRTTDSGKYKNRSARLVFEEVWQCKHICTYMRGCMCMFQITYAHTFYYIGTWAQKRIFVIFVIKRWWSLWRLLDFSVYGILSRGWTSKKSVIDGHYFHFVHLMAHYWVLSSVSLAEKRISCALTRRRVWPRNFKRDQLNHDHQKYFHSQLVRCKKKRKKKQPIQQLCFHAAVKSSYLAAVVELLLPRFKFSAQELRHLRIKLFFYRSPVRFVVSAGGIIEMDVFAWRCWLSYSFDV